MTEYYFDGDPAVASTRRHLERVLKEPPPKRWRWLVAMLAGGAAVTFWRVRGRGGKRQDADASRSAPAGPTPR